MKSFYVDLYLWYEEAGMWMFIPPYPSKLQWSAKFSQSELLACEAGITFRINDVLWLSNERDTFPIEVVVFDLYNTLSDSEQDEELLAKLRVSKFQAIEIKQNLDRQILLSRLNTREDEDYLEQIANFVGTYYKDFPVEWELWQTAVNRTLDGLALAFGRSEADVSTKNNPLAKWLVNRFQNLIV